MTLAILPTRREVGLAKGSLNDPGRHSVLSELAILRKDGSGCLWNQQPGHS
jgi:hypothetical protein